MRDRSEESNTDREVARAVVSLVSRSGVSTTIASEVKRFGDRGRGSRGGRSNRSEDSSIALGL